MGKIEDAFFEANAKGLASEPLTVELLQGAKDELRKDHYNWLFISVWFGLRPLEIDELQDKDTWTIRKEGNIQVFTVYQSKLTSISRDKRWKLIPILFPEEEEAMRIIKSGEFSRPLVKTLETKVGEGITCYGGRKNFTDLMLDKGYSLESISAWMGHSSIETTWQKYKNRLAVSIKKIS
ncbi:MAG: site-specific integrase [Deltaproteobacteria bacterium]|nr:site-specific integrase [Deltaproteobacteria bacterium]